VTKLLVHLNNHLLYLNVKKQILNHFTVNILIINIRYFLPLCNFYSCSQKYAQLFKIRSWSNWKGVPQNVWTFYNTPCYRKQYLCFNVYTTHISGFRTATNL